MSRFARLAVSLPLLIVAAAAVTPRPGLAQQTLGPAAAAGHLAMAHTAAGRCAHLSETEREELASYAAAAEVAAVHSDGVGAVTSAIAGARKRGEAVACDEASAGLSRSALEAARTAMAAATAAQPPRAAKPAQAAPRTQAALAAPAAAPEPQPARRTDAARRADAALGEYTRLTAAYYVERRCHHLERRDAMRFWSSIVTRHNALLAVHPGAEVARAKRAAEREADVLDCSRRTARLVAEAYRSTLR